MEHVGIKLIAAFGILLSVDLSAGQNCRSCILNGIKFDPNKAFEYRADCIEMTDCFCYCDGTTVCKKERNTCDRTVESARDFRTNTRTTYRSSSSSSSSSSSQSGFGSGQVITDVRNEGCRKCLVDGGEIDGGTYFSHSNGCMSYSSCYCGCDGKWQCPAQNAKNTCTGSGSGLIIGSEEGGCRSCVIDGVPYVGNSDFTYRNNCLEWSDCRCRCDGSWRCASNSARWVCDNVCRECEVDGITHPGRSQFRYEKECTVYDPCTCHCNGSWNCPAENGKWICTDKCLECSVNGRRYPGNSEFSLREDCWEWNPCNCNCDGSWECPRENAKWVCTDQCLQCDVNGKKYDGNTLFQYTDGCYEYNCNCRCDGGWSCPANRTRDTCRLNMATGCYYCNVNGKRFEGNSLFTYEDNCIRYDQCTCNCDGSWECPGERAVNTCRRNSTTGCNYCDVYGQQREGNSRYEIQQDCWRYDCECDCNGNWRCNEATAQYICGSQLLDTSGCKSCLAEGQRYAGQSSFDITWGCVTHKCTCNCDGSWICPSRLAKNTCADSHFQQFLIRTITNLPKSWCTECTIGGSVYPGYSQFEYQEQCTRQYARCYCNGGYRFDSSIITGCSGSLEISVANGNCIECKFNNEVFAPRSEFEISSQCKRYRCRCECNGRAACQSVTENVCGTVLTTIRSSQVVSGGGSETVVVGTGGGTTVESGRVVVSSGGSSGTTGSRTVVVGGGTSGTESTVGTGTSGGSRTVVVGTIPGQRTESQTVVVGNGGGSSSSQTSVVVSTGGSSGVSSGAVVSSGSGSACYHCVGLDGKRYPGNSDFTFRRGCAVWKCQCNCYGRAVCRPHDLSACLVEQQCKNCVVEGRTYQSNRMFSYEKDCVLHQCRCMCDGRARCVQTVSTDCERGRQTCTPCVIDGVRYPSNSMFDIETQCSKQRCQCDCNGQHRCSRAINTCSGDDLQPTCQPCDIDGRKYDAGTTFQVDRGCYRMTCSCSCRDRLVCDQSATVNICNDDPRRRCQACTVDGERYAPNSKFEREVGCTRYQCQCLCDGKYDCASTGENICDDDDDTSRTIVDSSRTTTESTSERRTIVTRPEVNPVVETGDCKACIADGVARTVGTPFCLDRGCNRYTCECDCQSGRYGCQTDKPENICDDAGKVIAQPCQSSTVSRTETSGSRETSSSTNRETSQETRTTTVTETKVTQGSGGSITTLLEYEERRGGVAVADADRRGRCLQCNIQEVYYQGNSDFFLQLGCKRFRCNCNCDSSWECPRQRPQNTCESQGDCRPCRLRGEEYPPNSRFTIDIDECRKYQCTCPCNGRYECPASDVLNTCTSNVVDNSQCRDCTVNGNRYRSNTEFSYDEGCNRFNCECKCDGSWTCPATKTVNTCTNPDTGRCRECEVKGNKYRGNSRFSYDEDCFRFNCDCNCDGSWNCPATRTERICDSSTPRNDQCRECEVKGQRYRGNSRFSYDEDCFRFNCDCNCDGSWNCPSTRTERICNTSTTGSDRCRECEVNGQRYRGNSRFSYDEDCFRFNCDCNCDGSWNCPSTRTERICDSSTSDSSGRCRECVVNGQRYRGNTRFSYDEDCFRYNCDCKCDGSWECPATRTERICSTVDQTQTGQCRECVVDNRRYRGNSQFQFDRGCNRYTCDCDCSGSYNCPASKTIDICRGRQTSSSELQSSSEADRVRVETGRTGSRTSVESKTVTESRNTGTESISSSTLVGGSQTVTELRSRSGTTSGSRADSRGCRYCVVNKVEYRGNSAFQFDDNCSRFNCECRCDGSWTCPASRTVNICPDKCQDCRVKGKSYPANTIFEYDEGCTRYNCDCSCDGSYNCPADRSKDICGGRPDTCRECEVEGQKYPSNRRFQYEKGCFRYDCDCQCDGSWRCPSDRSTNICRGVESTTCRECYVNGKRYQPNKDFSYIDDCDLNECKCNCDGSYTCPSKKDICSSSAQICRDCLVNGKRYLPNKPFQYTNRCERFNCNCLCNGSWNCPAERTENLCTSGQCSACKVRNTSYQGNSVFVLTENCRQFQCQCHCDGQWQCSKESVNVCNQG